MDFFFDFLFNEKPILTFRGLGAAFGCGRPSFVETVMWVCVCVAYDAPKTILGTLRRRQFNGWGLATVPIPVLIHRF